MNKKKRNFQGMSYRVMQINNSQSRLKLYQEDQSWLRKNGYKNVGWNHVISLYEKIAEFLKKYNLNDLTLEELFLEADRIGNKYQTIQEITNFNQKLAIEVNEIADSIDTQFPDTEIEFIDFSNNFQNKNRKKHQRNSHI
ncbi:hypothetical protein [Nostoc sp. UHCC 0870]|uniref:hypothetical protein n=1 Tax=Nostoc sp. UHCC 0870 TaxID=2914041 RepID=UPI001EE0A8F6|nr:hypothetical protein [Nostoc sp. UHCC 0870]UKO96664.1 hypothetical protein L6494_18875 [Nostoc sp. UHCC 0870]